MYTLQDHAAHSHLSNQENLHGKRQELANEEREWMKRIWCQRFPWEATLWTQGICKVSIEKQWKDKKRKEKVRKKEEKKGGNINTFSSSESLPSVFSTFFKFIFISSIWDRRRPFLSTVHQSNQESNSVRKRSNVLTYLLVKFVEQKTNKKHETRFNFHMKVNKSYWQNWVKQKQKQKHENCLNFHSKVIEKKQKKQDTEKMSRQIGKQYATRSKPVLSEACKTGELNIFIRQRNKHILFSPRRTHK